MSIFKSPHLVIITGYYGFDNLGDEAILEELLTELSLLSPKEATVVLSNNPKRTSSLYKIKSINRWHWLEYLKLLPQTKLLISGGGGLFQDRTGMGSVFFYGAQILLARLFGIKVLIYAQGLGPLQKSLTRKITQIVFRQANVVTLRDPNSLSLAEAWGIKAKLTADPVWNLSPSSMNEPVKILLDKMRSTPPNKNMIIGISLRDDPMLKDYHFEFLARTIAHTFSPQTVVLLLPLQQERDHEPLKKLEQHLKHLGLSSHLFDPTLLSKPSEWLSVMQNIDLLIGMRLHALLMALKVGKPVIGIAYDPKVTYLLNEFGQSILSLDIANDEVSQAIWQKTITEFVNEKDEYVNRAQQKLDTVKELAKRNITSLTNIYEVATTGNATATK